MYALKEEFTRKHKTYVSFRILLTFGMDLYMVYQFDISFEKKIK